MKTIKTEKEAGLQSFVPGDEKERIIDYFNGVLKILNYINSGNGRFRKKKQCILWLIKNSPKEGKESINEIRLSLLFTIGLIFENKQGIQLTGIGNQIIETESKVEFYKRLLGAFPEFEIVESYLKDNKEVHPKMIAKEGGYGNTEYWAIRLRWLESLDRVKSYYIGKQKYYSHFNEKEDVV